MTAIDPSAVHGRCAAGFEQVREEFVRNFAERGEVGAGVSVVVDGETVVDLWGGVADEASGRPWTEDTICQVWSSTKGATALCAHILVDRGQLDLDAPVARYWPEFAQAGKESVTVRMVLTHQAGLPALRAELPPGGFYDWEAMAAALAAEEPFWEPGTRHGYHAFTFGWLVGELVRRVSGRSLGTFFREEVAQPLGLDFWIGLPPDHDPRTATMIPQPPPAPDQPLTAFFTAVFTQPGSLPFLLFVNTGGYMAPGESDTRAARAAELGAVGAITNGRGLAGMYTPLALGGEYRGVRIVSPDAVARMGAVAVATTSDAALLTATRFSLGFVKAIDNRAVAGGERDSIILSEEAFGHTGFGGSIGFADPAARLAFGYAMNRMGEGAGLNPRGQSLVDATYRALGYRTDAVGTWIR